MWCCGEYSHFNSVIGTHELPDDDQLLIEICRSAFTCFSECHFKLMFYYIDVHLLAHYIQ
jgi:hypothetical protein